MQPTAGPMPDCAPMPLVSESIRTISMMSRWINDSPHDTDGSGLSLKTELGCGQTIAILLPLPPKIHWSDCNKIHCDASPLQLCEATFPFRQTMSLPRKLRWQGESGQTGIGLSGVFYLDEDIAQDNDNDILRDFSGHFRSGSYGHIFFWLNDINTKSTAIFFPGRLCPEW